MKKYLIVYDLYDDLLDILGHDVPHTNLSNVKIVTVELEEQDYQRITAAGIKLVEDIPVRIDLCDPISNIAQTGIPTPINEYLHISQAHLAGFTGISVNVSLLDSGANDSAVVVTPSLIRQDYTGTGVQDDLNHGGKGCNIIGQIVSTDLVTPVTYGMAHGCQLYSMKVLNSTIEPILAAIDWCIGNNIHIMNMSFAIFFETDTSVLTAAINAALAANIIIVAASGNDPNQEIFLPGSLPGVICVNAVAYNNANNGVIGSYSNPQYGYNAQVVVTNYNGGHAQTFAGGTSQAAFMLSGLLAIYKQKYPNLNTEKAINLLRRKAIQMDGYTYNIHCSTKGVLLNQETGAGFLSPIN